MVPGTGLLGRIKPAKAQVPAGHVGAGKKQQREVAQRVGAGEADGTITQHSRTCYVSNHLVADRGLMREKTAACHSHRLSSSSTSGGGGGPPGCEAGQGGSVRSDREKQGKDRGLWDKVKAPFKKVGKAVVEMGSPRRGELSGKAAAGPRGFRPQLSAETGVPPSPPQQQKQLQK